MVRAGKKRDGGQLEISQEHQYWLAFSGLRGIGPKRFGLLVSFFGSAKAAWLASPADWRQLGLAQAVVTEWQNQRRQELGRQIINQLKTSRVRAVFLDDHNYPQNLKELTNPPFVLYFQGHLPVQLTRPLAVVGTRRMTSYGEQVTGSLVAELAAAGVTVVSGLARGIDGVAHKTALKAGGVTVGVLGSGHVRFYPAEHQSLGREMIENDGAVLSEYPPLTSPQPAFFPARNRLIAGLSQGVVVVEGGLKSGSLITAGLALELGREVFAVPGPIFNPASQGPAYLVQAGAKLITSAQDVLTELGWENRLVSGDQDTDHQLSAREEQLVYFLQSEPLHVNLLARKLDCPVGEIAGLLTMMELKKIVIHVGNMVYRLSK